MEQRPNSGGPTLVATGTWQPGTRSTRHRVMAVTRRHARGWMWFTSVVLASVALWAVVIWAVSLVLNWLA